jgi:uncharacterized protein YndB with AHSA1/START domain
MKKITLEYIIQSSPGVLFRRLSTASGLAEWFADDVKVKGDTFTFCWDGDEEEATLLKKKENEFVQFHWSFLPSDTFLEFRLKRDELTGELALIVTDFIDEDEEQEGRDLWDAQIGELFRILGN